MASKRPERQTQVQRERLNHVVKRFISLSDEDQHCVVQELGKGCSAKEPRRTRTPTQKK